MRTPYERLLALSGCSGLWDEGGDLRQHGVLDLPGGLFREHLVEGGGAGLVVRPGRLERVGLLERLHRGERARPERPLAAGEVVLVQEAERHEPRLQKGDLVALVAEAQAGVAVRR